MRTIRLLLCVMACSSITTLASPSVSTGLLAPAQFKAQMALPQAVLINVHVPDEGALPNTKLRLPFDTIASNPSVPRNKSALILLYCRSGHMSAIAAKSLKQLGYTQIYELKGGFEAWKAAGYALAPGR